MTIKIILYLYPMDCTGIVENFHSKLWGHHVIIPESVALQYVEGSDRRVICVLNGTVKIKCALMKAKRGWFILLNHEIRQKLRVEEGDELKITIEKDTSEYGMDVPDELKVMLEQDPEASDYFYQLTKGKQRNLIYIVSKVKNMDSRINKALAIVSHLKEVEGHLDFKKLNQSIKYFNNLKKL